MGRYYALHDGEAAEVAEALREQYLPRFAGDALPATRTGMARFHRRQARHDRRHLRDRPEADRDARSLRPATRRARSAAHVDRTAARSRPAAPDRAGPRRVAVRRTRNECPRGVRLHHRTAARVLRRGRRRLRGHGRNVRRGARHATGVGARFRRPPARTRAVPAVARRGEPRGSEQAHRRTSCARRPSRSATTGRRANCSSIRRSRCWPSRSRRWRAKSSPRFAARDYTPALLQLSALRTAVDDFFDSVHGDGRRHGAAGQPARAAEAHAGLFMRAADLSRLPG